MKFRSRTGATMVLCLVLAGCSKNPEVARNPKDSSPKKSATAPSDTSGGAATFAVKGDWGSGLRSQTSLTQRMCEVRKTRPFQVVMTTGDNFYNPDGKATEKNYNRPEKCLTTYPGHTWRASWGNHDTAGDSTASVLGATDHFYSWKLGDAEIFMLDSNLVGDAGQLAWLESALSNSPATLRIAAFHHSPFTVGLHESDLNVQRRWVPLFEKHKVELVLTGHSHGYEHFVVNGIDYVVSGGGGAAIHGCRRSENRLLLCSPKHNFLIVEISPEKIVLDAIGAEGELLDRVEIATQTQVGG